MTEEPTAQPDRRGRLPRSLSVRGRILTAVLITTALGMLFAGGVSYLIARDSTYEDIKSALVQENEEIRAVAKTANEGQSGRPINGPSDVLYLAIRNSVPDPNEAIFAMVNGKVVWVPNSDNAIDFAFQKSVQEDPGLIAAASATRPDEQVQVRQLSTKLHPRLAYIAVPVQVDGSNDLGLYVAAVDVDASFASVNRTHLTYAGICLLALVVVGLVGYSVAGRLLSPLRALSATAQRITDTDLSDRIPDDQLSSQDEVADLGRTMNAMLDRLSGSFDNQRRLLDDAGHELRTPITIVRGHLELVDPNDPQDVRETRDIALDELDRMQRLVDDIMVLAKARRPDFVHTAPTAVGELLSEVLDKVTPLADRAWTIDRTTGTVALLDRQRVTQALVQLVSNALRFTTDGSVIALGAERAGSDVRIWVRDAGSGIASEDRERIFERFGRGGREIDTWGDDGAGLGLAIVTAIADAHHGRVTLESEVGRGSTFTLRLPLGLPPAEIGPVEHLQTTTRPQSTPRPPSTSRTEEPSWQPS